MTGDRRRDRNSALCGITGVLVVIAAAGCPKRSPPKPTLSMPAQPPATIPAEPPAAMPATPETVPAPPEPAATQPAASLPASTYDSKPPYPVELHVRSPEDKQPGWLKILELADDNSPATATGTFPQQNRIYVDTNNAHRIRIHIGHLPLAQRKRIILQIDGQGVEISRKLGREFLVLQRRPTGVWQVVKPGEKE